MENNVRVITGANSGIGFECIKQFCEEFINFKILAISRSINNLCKLSYTNLEIIECNIVDHQILQHKLTNIIGNSYIHGLINCAGNYYNEDFCKINIEEY